MLLTVRAHRDRVEMFLLTTIVEKEIEMRQTHPASRRRMIASTWKMALATLAAVTCTVTAPAAAQDGDWPNRTVKVIVPFPAGSFTDTVARVLSERLTKALGQPVIVENKAGANGLIGVAEAARAAPDGYTLLVTNSSSITINPQIYKKATYKPSDLTPVTLVLQAPFILVANPEWARKNSIDSVKDLVQFAAQNPGKLNYGSAGQGNIAHLGFAIFGNQTNTTATHIPYKSAAQAQLALLSGELDVGFDTWTALPHIASGKLKALATTSTKRMVQLPNVPTIEEAGVAPFDVTFWIGMLAPAGTPPQIVQRLYSISHGLLDDSKAKATLEMQGDVVMADPTRFAQRIEKEVADWGEVIKREGITLD